MEAPKAPSKLAHYRALCPAASIHVSPIQLGAMSIGDKWFPGTTKDSCFTLLDTYFDNGGNFVDTANVYQNETSEMFLGEWMEKRDNRDQLVLATKYSQDYKARQPGFTNHASFIGNNVKSMHLSLEASLKKLRTSYIDIFYVHWWDWQTSIEEVMNGLHNLVVQGKVLYLGVSDTPAWVVSQANQYARDHGKTPFVIYQGCWNLLERSFEREIIPMARAHALRAKQHPGMALAPWNVLAAGKFRTAAQEEERVTAGEKDRMMYHPVNARPENKIVSEALEKVAADVGAKSIQAVAIAYILQKTPYCFPVIGGRKTEHLLANLEALDITLSKEQIAFLENAVPFDPGFPNWMIGDGTKHSSMWAASGTFVEQPLREPIRPVRD
ncbi:Aldo/keto reductase [Mycena amicta]|nr:Aldo/keto reductase [Mycena amicta]